MIKKNKDGQLASSEVKKKLLSGDKKYEVIVLEVRVEKDNDLNKMIDNFDRELQKMRHAAIQDLAKDRGVKLQWSN